MVNKTVSESLQQGRGSVTVQGGILEKTLCSAMHCWVPAQKICYTQAEQRAYVGTTCGNHKWCMKGKCIADPRAGVAKGGTGIINNNNNNNNNCMMLHDLGRRLSAGSGVNL